MRIMHNEVLVHVDFTVAGNVTEVGFRRSVKRRADALRLRGWVANTSSTGRVIGHVEGPYYAVQEFKGWLALDGPPSADVHKVTFTDESRTEEYEHGAGFNIIYFY